MEKLLDQNPCYLYKHYDSDGNLLYVGISFSIAQRISQHKKSSNWFADSGHITILKFASRSLAEEAEQKSIRNENPLHNVLHRRSHAKENKKWAKRIHDERYGKFYQALIELNEKLDRLDAQKKQNKKGESRL